MTMSLWAGARVHLTVVDPGTSALAGNVGLHVGDQTELVRARRASLADVLGRDIVWMNQTHSTVVEVITSVEGVPTAASTARALDHRAPGQWGPVEADGIIIDARGWEEAPALAVLTADCLPVVFSAAGGRVVAAVHAGRRGLLGGILMRTVDLIRARVDGSIDALIGPAICGSCYEVPSDMVRQSEEIMPGIGSQTSWGTPSLDLPRAAASQLRERGVRVVSDSRCTLETPTLFSYRRDRECGRQALVIAPA